MKVKTVVLFGSCLNFLFKTLVLCDILVFLQGFLEDCFFKCCRIFLPKIVNDFKWLLFRHEIIKRLGSQDNCTDSHEKGFYQNVKKYKMNIKFDFVRFLSSSFYLKNYEFPELINAKTFNLKKRNSFLERWLNILVWPGDNRKSWKLTSLWFLCL